MATIQLSLTKNGSFKICGKDLFGKSDGSETYSPAEIFAIIKLWKNGDFGEADTNEKTCVLGKMDKTTVENFVLCPESNDDDAKVSIVTCIAKKGDGIRCSRNSNGDDGLCTQHRAMKKAGK